MTIRKSISTHQTERFFVIIPIVNDKEDKLNEDGLFETDVYDIISTSSNWNGHSIKENALSIFTQICIETASSAKQFLA